MKDLRVVLFPEEYPPAPGGIAISARRIAENLLQEGVSVSVVTYDHVGPENPRAGLGSYVRETVEERGLTVTRIGPVPTDYSLAEGRRSGAVLRNFADRFIRLMEKRPPHVIHSLGARHAGFVGTLIARQLGVAHVVGVRGNDIGRDLYSSQHFPSLQFTLASASHVTYVSSRLYQLASRALGYRPNWTIVHNACELEAPDGSPIGILPPFSSPIVVGVFSHIREKKGILELLNAVATMSDRDPRPALAFVGRPSSEAWYTSAIDRAVLTARAAGIEVALPGPVPRGTALSLMRSCDIIAQPSLDDGFPNTICEAMSIGKPMLVSDVFRGDLPSSGVVEYCCPHDPGSIIAGMQRLMQSPSVRDTMAAAAARFAEWRFRPAREANEYAKIYDTVMATHSAGYR